MAPRPSGSAQLWPDQIAIDAPDRRSTWGQTLDRVQRLAGAMTGLAPIAGGRIALLGLNSPEYLELTLAVPLTGRAMVTLNYRLAPEEQAHTLRECPCAVL